MSSMSTEGSSLISSSAYTSILPPAQGCCHFVKGNRKPLLFLSILIFLGAGGLITVLYLDHSGFWTNPITIDTVWFRQTLLNTSSATTPNGLYASWLRAANPLIRTRLPNVSDSYLYRSQYGRLWNLESAENNLSTVLTQCRLITVFASAWNVTRNISYFVAMENGIHVLLTRFNDSEHGGFLYSINESANSESKEWVKNAESHSAVLMALSTAFLVTPSTASEDEKKAKYIYVLNATFELFNDHFIDEYGGIHGNLTREWMGRAVDTRPTRPLVAHLEALTYLYKMSRDLQQFPDYSHLLKREVVRQHIDDLFQFIVDLLSPYLYSQYDGNWSSPVSESEVSLGNAWTLSHSIRDLIDSGALSNESSTVMDDIVSYALLGYDEDHGKVHNEINYTATLNPPYWTVCEAIRAMLRFWNFDEKNDEQWLGMLQDVTSYYRVTYYDGLSGGVFFQPPTLTWKGSIFKLDKNCIEMHLSAAQISWMP